MAAEGRGDFAERAVGLAATVSERGLMQRADMSRAWRERPFSTFVATGGGIGMIPFAPGTWGSLEGVAIAVLLARRTYPMFRDTAPARPLATPAEVAFLVIAGAALLIFIGGTIASGRAEAFSGSRDPGAIVVDEVAGQMIASSPAVLLGGGATLWLASFLLFRLFDIWKPGLINKLQALPGGWGIMMDDVAAGILAGAMTYGIGRVIG